MYGGKTAAEMVALVIDAQGQEGLRHRQEFLAGAVAGDKDTEKAWRKALNDGVVAVDQACRGRESFGRREKAGGGGRGGAESCRHRNRSRVLSELLDLGRAVRQQRLDAGSSGSDHQAGVGQCGDDQSRDGARSEA